MQRLISMSVMAAILMGISSGARANSQEAGTIKFTGEIVDSACKLTTDPQLVDLGRQFKSEIDNNPPKKPFKVVLEDCPAGRVKMSFVGEEHEKNSELLAFDKTGGSSGLAQGYGLRLFDHEDSLVNLNADMKAVELQEGDNTLSFAAAYERIPGEDAKGGQANGLVTLQITY